MTNLSQDWSCFVWMGPIYDSELDRCEWMRPIYVSELDRHDRMSPIYVSELDRHNRMSPIYDCELDRRDRMSPIYVSELDRRDWMSPIYVSELDRHDRMSPIYVCELDRHDWMSPIYVCELDRHDWMSPIYVCELDRRNKKRIHPVSGCILLCSLFLFDEREYRSSVFLQLLFERVFLSSKPRVELRMKSGAMIHVKRVGEFVKKYQFLEMHRQEQREKRKIDVVTLLCCEQLPHLPLLLLILTSFN